MANGIVVDGDRDMVAEAVAKVSGHCRLASVIKSLG